MKMKNILFFAVILLTFVGCMRNPMLHVVDMEDDFNQEIYLQGDLYQYFLDDSGKFDQRLYKSFEIGDTVDFQGERFLIGKDTAIRLTYDTYARHDSI